MLSIPGHVTLSLDIQMKIPDQPLKDILINGFSKFLGP